MVYGFCLDGGGISFALEYLGYWGVDERCVCVALLGNESIYYNVRILIMDGEQIIHSFRYTYWFGRCRLP